MEPQRITKLYNKEVRIEPTNLCNYECVMCPREKHTRKKGIMSMELYKKIIDEIVPIGCEKVTLTNFGEPFIDPYLEDKIKIANDKGLKTYVITNASLFHKPSINNTISKIENAIKSGLKEIRISFYGNDKLKHENIMKGSDFEQTLKNLELLYNLKKTHKSFEVSQFILEFNEKEEQENYPEILKKLVDYYEIWRPHNFGDGRNYRKIEEIKKTSCGRPMNGPLQINWNGTVVPCCYDYNENIILGNVEQSSILEILNSEKYNSLRESHIKNEFYKFKYCDNCDQLLCNKHSTSIVKSTNPIHSNLTKEEIVKRTNTSPEVSISF